MVNSVPSTVATTVSRFAFSAANGEENSNANAIPRKIECDFTIVSSFEAYGLARAVDTVMLDPYIDWVALRGPADLCTSLSLFIS
tara:strand:- start:520 stop:774 length:255 start_codon:yes stop_codon:yes gene_type:complete